MGLWRRHPARRAAPTAPAAWLILAALLLAAAIAAPAAADTGDIIAPNDATHPEVNSGWQAGTCTEEPPAAAAYCSIATPSHFFETASAHPPWGFTQFIVKHSTVGSLETPEGELRTIRVDLPVGLSVNPGATERCTQAQFDSESCPEGSEVGRSEVWASVGGVVFPPQEGITKVPVYNVSPPPGQSARFGLKLAGNDVYLEGDVDWSGNFHEGFTIHVPAVVPAALGEALLPLAGEPGAILKNRLAFEGRSGDGTFLTTPTTCLGPAYAADWVPGEQPGGPSGHVYSTLLRADSVGEPDPDFPNGSSFFESPIPPLSETSGPGTEPRSCNTIPYRPSLDVNPGNAQADSPAAAAVDITVPHLLPNFESEENEQDSSHTRQATVTLPDGMGLNPAAANGLQVCTDAQFGKGTENPIACPAASIVGRAKIESPPLKDEGEPQPEEDLEGPVYVGKQLSREPTSGDEYRIFIDASSTRYGIDVRLIGNVRADPVTGQLATTISEAPQVPFTSFKLTFAGGAHAVLTTPPTCGPNQASAVMTPWSGNPPARPGDSFALTSAPGGGPCAGTLAARPFAPGFSAGPASSRAGAYSPLTVRFDRPDGQQELKGADLVLPPGMTGRLAGIPYCPEAAIAAASTRAGQDESANPSCPAASQVGGATVLAGSGPDPYRIAGRVYLAGPYRGAPLSLAVITPATAGPFDLGTVVTRVALFVDPETAQIRSLSDTLPHVFGGTKLSLRQVELKMDRPNFTRNPTSCDPLASTGTIAGGGGDPNNPAAFSSFPVSAPLQTSDCGALGFKPKLYLRLFGGRKATRRAGHPKLRAVLVAREGDANIRRAAVTLPHSQFLDQGHIGTVCTRVQLAAAACPARSVYGFARARTPLLDDELAGPVYLVSSDHELPDLLADLHGQVDVRLRGVISSAKQRLKTVFFPVPDVPVSKFVLTMKGGKKGLLQNSRDLCGGHRGAAFLNFRAQNAKRLKIKHLKIRVTACRKGHHKRHRHHRQGSHR
ncbi:MAG TPA: hypothetical protein VFN82_02175 [Solirubrobacterales bacterium]|nr:hypothetical protein [Solirubrobacterales bacterium]